MKTTPNLLMLHQKSQTNSPLHLRSAQNHMATTFEFIVSGSPGRLAAARQCAEEAHRLVEKLESELSEYREQSPIFALNHADPGEWVELPQSALELLQRSQRLEAVSARAFTCLAKSKEPLNFESAIEIEGTRARRLTPSAWIGFGAIGKGYALDKVRESFELSGIEHYLLNAGGSSLILSGFSAPGEPWQWAWSWAKDEDGDPVGISFAHATGIPVAIGVSGTQEKGDHLLNFDSKSPTYTLSSSLVGHPAATEADALSTALFVGGWESSHSAMAQLETAPALAAIAKDETPYWNGSFQKMWGALAAFLFFALPAFADEGAVDLNDLGIETFTPYLFERNYWWMALPLFMLVIVFIHLKNSRPKPRVPTLAMEEKSEIINDQNINGNAPTSSP